MNWENWPLVTDEPVEVQDFRKLTNPFRGIYRTFHNLIKKNWKMSICNQLVLETLGSRPIMPKKIPRKLICAVIWNAHGGIDWRALPENLTLNYMNRGITSSYKYRYFIPESSQSASRAAIRQVIASSSDEPSSSAVVILYCCINKTDQIIKNIQKNIKMSAGEEPNCYRKRRDCCLRHN